MEYEPAIYITDASGKIVERFDAIFDADEINAAIATLGL
jgi:glutathione peroxidase-family protein